MSDSLKESDQRLTDPEPTGVEEKGLESGLRPSCMADYIGQTELKENLDVFITAAKKRGGALDHCLFYGPPGLGKTTLAHIIGGELGANVKTTSGPVIQKPGDLAAILTNLELNDVLFIDEIHRLNATVEEILYPAMEDYKLDILIGQGPMARTVKLDLPAFTLVGATTRAGLLSSPLRERFGIPCHLQFYTAAEIQQIIMRSSELLNLNVEPEGSMELARRSRGTPRVANRLLRRIRDFAEQGAHATITLEVVVDSLERWGVERYGLESMHRQLLRVIVEKFEGGPVGLSTLAAALSETKDTIEEVFEPYLIQDGFLQRTPQGRVATSKALDHLGCDPGPGAQLDMLNE